MDANENLVVPKNFLDHGDNSSAFLNPPNLDSVKPFYPQPSAHFCNSVCMKLMAMHAPDKASDHRNRSSIVYENSGADSSDPSVISYKDSELDSDAESSSCHQLIGSVGDILVEEEEEEEEGWRDELWEEEGGAREKLELLAWMVGVSSNEPEVVLAEVVRVLKDLERRRNMFICLN